MTRILLLSFIPVLLGNSAGGLGGLVILAGGAFIGLGVISGIVWGLIRWLS